MLLRLRERLARPQRCGLAALGLLLTTTFAAGQEVRRGGGSLLLGQAEPMWESPPLDANLPTGALRVASPRPRHSRWQCTPSGAACAHSSAGSEELLRQYAAALQSAQNRLVSALGLPAPLSDVDLGPTPGLDLYLLPPARSIVANAEPRGRTSRRGPQRNQPQITGPNAPLLRAYPLEARLDPDLRLEDRSSAHCLASAQPALIQEQAALCVAAAIVAGISAAEAPAIRRSLAMRLARRLAPPSANLRAAQDDYQANPQRSLLRRDTDGTQVGASLFWEYLAKRFPTLANGRSDGRGEIGLTLLALSPTRTEVGAVRWNNEPDALDALRWLVQASSAETAKDSRAMGDLLLDYALERAASSDGSWPQRARFDWRIAASSLPRHLALSQPLEPYGTALFWVDLDQQRDGPLALRATWEQPVELRWAVALVSASGHLLRRLDLAAPKGRSSAERVLEDLDGGAALLLAAVNLGAVAPLYPFDVDHEPWEPHGLTLYLTPLQASE